MDPDRSSDLDVPVLSATCALLGLVPPVFLCFFVAYSTNSSHLLCVSGDIFVVGTGVGGWSARHVIRWTVVAAWWTFLTFFDFRGIGAVATVLVVGIVMVFAGPPV